MKTRDFIAHLDDAAVIAAIRCAESKTSGEIRVFISRRLLGSDDFMARATKRFQKLGMTRTRERNAVLLYFMPRERRFAVVGDTGVHAKCAPTFWEEVTACIEARIRSGLFTEAVVGGIERVGELLAEHFPASPGDRQNLPDEVGRD